MCQTKIKRSSLSSSSTRFFAFIIASVSLYLVSSLSLALICKLFKGKKSLNHICKSYNALMVNFVRQLDWAPECPDIWSDVLGVSLKEINICISKADHPP